MADLDRRKPLVAADAVVGVDDPRVTASRRRLAAALFCLTLLGGGRVHGEVPVSGPPDQGAGAVVFAYGRFGEDQYGPVSIGLDQFEQHLEELADGAYTVMPLPAVLDRLRRGAPLPDRTVALTIDDAHRSVYREAFPRLKKAGLPFTLFVAPAASVQKPCVSEVRLSEMLTASTRTRS